MAYLYKQTITSYVIDVAAGTKGAKQLPASGRVFYARYSDAAGRQQLEPLAADRREANRVLAELLDKQPAADGALPEVFLPEYTGWVKRVKSTTPGARKVRGKSKKWYGRYRDPDGAIHKVPLCEEKKLAQARLTDLERDANRRKAGYADDFTPHAQRSVLDHAAEFRDHLQAKGNSPKYVKQRYNRVVAVVKGCRFVRLNEIQESKVELWLERERGGDTMGEKTSNYYVGAMKQFGNWLVKDKRIPANPFQHLDTMKAQDEYERRPLTSEEFEWLIAATSNSGHVFRRLAGEDRAMLYLLAANTGFRANELATLTPARFDLQAETPTVTIEAGYSKRRRRDVQPIRPDIAARLADYLASEPHKRTTAAAAGRKCEFDQQRGQRFNGRLWASSWFNNAARMLRRDLRAARAVWLRSLAIDERRDSRESDFLRYVDSSNKVADFHALRHTFITNLAAAGVHPKTAQELARHSTIRLTMDRYAHVGLRDAAGALDSLPELPGQSKPESEALRATGTDDAKPPVRRPRERAARKATPATLPINTPQATAGGTSGDDEDAAESDAAGAGNSAIAANSENLFGRVLTHVRVQIPSRAPIDPNPSGASVANVAPQETRKPLQEQGLTSTATLETEKGAGRIRTGGGGFAICQRNATQPFAVQEVTCDGENLFTHPLTLAPVHERSPLSIPVDLAVILASDETLQDVAAAWPILSDEDRASVVRIVNALTSARAT